MKNKNYPLNNVKRITSIRELIDFRAAETHDNIVFKYKIGKTGLKTVTYSELKHQTEALGTELFHRGYKNIKAAILGENSYNWLLTFFALINGNNIAVPVDKEMSAESAENLIKASGCTVLIYSQTYSDIAEKIKENVSVDFICMDELSEMMKHGETLISDGNTDYTAHIVDEDCTAVIIYTSGTTGISKGVMLSHKNLSLDTYSACSNCFFYGDTVLLLPLHHSFGLVAGVFVIMLYGYSIYINSSLRNLSSDLIEAKPQCLFLVPLFVETLYKNIWTKAESSGKADLLRKMIKISNMFLKFGIDIRRKLFKSVLDAFGGNLDTVISGGAALNPKYIQGFREIGINLLNGYGITECSPVVSVNRNKYYKDGSVGQVLNECKVTIDNPNEKGEGEICVSGSIVMQGYYNMPSETNEVLNNGVFHTGDLGYLDNDGFLYVTGRVKNLIILSNGENVSPEELEELIQDCKLVGEVVVYEKNNCILAEIYPNMDIAEKNGISDIESEINRYISDLNRTLPKFKQINKVIIRDTEFEKTTTKKIKRNTIGG